MLGCLSHAPPGALGISLMQNNSGKKFVARLGYRRRRSLKMVEVGADDFRIATTNGGSCSFEWPRRCARRTQRPVVKMIVSLGLILADFDGCAFGAMGDSEHLAHKPWRLATSSRRLAGALDVCICRRDRTHVCLSRKWATDSGHYRAALCNRVLQVLVSSWLSEGVALDGLRLSDTHSAMQNKFSLPLSSRQPLSSG